MKLAFIGCGNIATYHSGVIRGSVKGIEIVAGCDIDSRALSAYGKEFGVRELYADYRELLANPDIEAVCVALPTGLHCQAVLDAARAGKQVFCEKPMAITVRDCDRMIDACERAGVLLMIGHVRRYDADWGAWKKIVQSGRIGRPVIWRQTAGGAGPGGWFMEAGMGEGPFMDGCVHNWDFANAVFGEPVEATGSLARLYGKTALDSGTAIVRYAGGDEVHLAWTWGLPAGTIADRANDIIGPRGAVLFPGAFDPTDHDPGFDIKSRGAYLVDTGKAKRLSVFPKRDMFAQEWKELLRCVRTGGAPLTDGVLGREAVRVARAVLRAGEKRSRVRIEAAR